MALLFSRTRRKIQQINSIKQFYGIKKIIDTINIGEKIKTPWNGTILRRSTP